MRILTNSLSKKKGLISISEADEYAPQVILFCIPLDKREAKNIKYMLDFESYFSDGIYAKINYEGSTETIYLEYVPSTNFSSPMTMLPRFVANVKGFKIDFCLSSLNFRSKQNKLFNIDYFYSGHVFNEGLENKRLVLLDPDWRQLDKLFLEERVVFTDWE